MLRPAWLLTLALAVGCGGKKHDAEPAPGSGSATTLPAGPPRLVPEAEIKTRLDGLMARLDANAKRRCTPPRIGERTLPGPGTDALVQLFEGKGELAACTTKLAALAKAGSLKADFEAGLPSAIAFDEACGMAVADKVLDIAAHGEGCSPYQVGVRAEPEELTRAIQIAHAIGFHVKRLHAAGKTTEALTLGLAGLRAMQDLARGHVTLILAMVSAAGTNVIADGLHRVLETAKLTEEDRATAAAAVDSLLVGVPLWADLVAGERDNMDIYFGAARLMPNGWTPPGGWNESLRASLPAGDSSLEKLGDPRDEYALLLVTSEEAAADQERACPAGSTYAVCHKALEAMVASTPDARADVKALYAELTAAVASGAPDADAIRLRIRRAVVNILKGVARPELAKFTLKLGEMIARLAAVRIHLQILGGPCPSAEALAAPPFSVLAQPPPLGDRLTLTVDDKGVRVGPPSWVDPVKVWTVACAR